MTPQVKLSGIVDSFKLISHYLSDEDFSSLSLQNLDKHTVGVGSGVEDFKHCLNYYIMIIQVIILCHK